ncbi:MAG: MMPL family transporter, partial [Solirubrobacterales bacterium]
MSELLAALARSIAGHWKRSLLVAFAVLAGLVVLAGTSSEPPADDFGGPGSESERALALFQDHTPALAGVDATVVLESRDGRLTSPADRQAIEKTVARIGELPTVLTVSDPFTPGAPTISRDGRIAFIDVRYDMEYGDVTPEDAERLEKAAAPVRSAGIETSVRGPVIDAASQQEFPIGEVIGVLIAIVLLTLLFRSGAAMVSTLAAALIGVMVGQLLLVILARPLGLPDFAATIAVMLGLGAGIDYALLIIGRF